MAGKSKRMKAAAEKLDRERQYAVEEALGLVKEFATVKFSESVDVSVNLGVDPRKSDQVVRGSTVLPNGTGKTVRVAVFAQGANADAAKEAGADVVGFEDLAVFIARRLGVVEVVGLFPIAAGIGHARIEHQLEQIVTDVIVVLADMKSPASALQVDNF